MKEGVPASNTLLDIARVVRYGLDTDVLQNDRRPTPLDNAEENVVFTGPLKRDVEPETVAIKRQRGRDIPYDEERRNAGDLCFSHVTFRFPELYAESWIDLPAGYETRRHPEMAVSGGRDLGIMLAPPVLWRRERLSLDLHYSWCNPATCKFVCDSRKACDSVSATLIGGRVNGCCRFQTASPLR